MMKRIWFVLLLFVLLPSTAYANIDDTMTQIIQWKKQQQQLDEHDVLLQDPFLQQAASSAIDWYAFSLGRLGITDDFDAYIAVTENEVAKRYDTPQKLDAMKATEWHRISLALLAVGADPTDVGGIHLIADGTYNRANVTSLGTQGINGFLWGLIALDSMRYVVPDDAHTTRDDIVLDILAAQLPDGGFSLYESTSDVDVTAMALQALAPYANSFHTYTYVQRATNKTVTKSVRTVIEEALAHLSAAQTNDGDFSAGGTPNAESTAQVLVALSALQIDPLTDERFLKNGHTVLDGLLRYQQADGGFIHAATYNENNPTSLPDASNSMASEQALYALIAYKRFTEKTRALYDMRPPFTDEERSQLDAFQQAFAKANLHEQGDVEQLLALYENIPAANAMYIAHFDEVQHAVKSLHITYDTPTFMKDMDVTTAGRGAVEPLIATSTQQDITKQDVMQFLQQQTYRTAHYSDALRYERFATQHMNEAVEPLQQIIEQIEVLQQQIDTLNEDILQHVYPIRAVTLDDQHIVRDIEQRFYALPTEEQQHIINYEDLQQLDAHMTSLVREMWLKRAAIGGTIVLAMFIVVRIIRRKREVAS